MAQQQQEPERWPQGAGVITLHRGLRKLSTSDSCKDTNTINKNQSWNKHKCWNQSPLTWHQLENHTHPFLLPPILWSHPLNSFLFLKKDATPSTSAAILGPKQKTRETTTSPPCQCSSSSSKRLPNRVISMPAPILLRKNTRRGMQKRSKSLRQSLKRKSQQRRHPKKTHKHMRSS